MSQKFVELAAPAIGEAGALRVVGEMRNAAAAIEMPALWALR